MTSWTLTFSRAADGRPTAHATDAPASRLAEFLTEEVHWPHYAAALAETAERANRGGSAPAASGNAYAVSFADGNATIEHLHQPDRPTTTVPLPQFIACLCAWERHLNRTDSGQ